MMSWKKWVVSGFMILLSALVGGNSALASFVVQAQETVSLEVKGYSGLSEITLFKGKLKAGQPQKIDSPYQGLGLLFFDKGQQYPVILGEQSFVLKITDPGHPPSFTGSTENDFFYKLLTGKEAGPVRFDFPLLMIEAKQLLVASSSIHTVADLAAMKERFHTLVSSHYQDLQHSDMLRRLIGQYFMMHEYVDFHVQGAPAGDIKVQYEKAMLNGVENWNRILKPYISAHEVVNYCVSLYYNRSMVTLAHLIVSRFKDIAFCPGSSLKTIQFPEDAALVDAAGNSRGTVKDFSNGVMAFVSEDCPVSMVETVIKARELAKQEKGAKLIVAPLQKLSTSHLAMRRMVAKDNMLFVGDEQWRQQMPEDIRLPLFVDIAASKL